MKNNYFLPYQQRWLDDKSKIKIWEKSRRIGATYVQTKTMFHEELYNFARKLMISIEFDIENNNKVDPGRMFAFTKMLPMINKIKEYEDELANKPDKAENKGITPDFVKLIETEILGMKPSEE